MKEIQLTQGKVALVDDNIFDELNQFKWCAIKRPHTYYACRHTRTADNKKRTLIYMHSVIAGGKDYDHKDRNGLNNQLNNLRQATYSQNSSNRERRKDNSSGFKGVYFEENRGKWRAIITVNHQRKHLGRFNNAVDAARAYDKAALELHGEFAKLNFSVQL